MLDEIVTISRLDSEFEETTTASYPMIYISENVRRPKAFTTVPVFRVRAGWSTVSQQQKITEKNRSRKQ